MKTKYFIITLVAIATIFQAKAQKSSTDSSQVAIKLKKLLTICKTVDFANKKVTDSGLFYKAAHYIVYRGEDKKRAWKDVSNYNDKEEKKHVDEVCYRINSSINQDSTYKIVKYFTEKESEGTWHVLMVTYKRKGVEKKTAFAFLKINNSFCLGDID